MSLVLGYSLYQLVIFLMKSAVNWQEAKDEAVLKASVAEPSLFKILVDRYREAFLRKAKTVVRNDDAAEDVVQEAFVKIYRNAPRFKKREGIEFKSWAYKVLMNTSFTHYAKLQKTRNDVSYADFLEYGERDIDDGENYLSRQEMRNSIETVLVKMPLPLASALRAYYFDDKSYKDIATQHNITLSALKLRIFRGKRLFRKLFEA